MLQTATPLLTGNWQASSETYETGDLAYGNANPSSPDFNSLADFIFAGDYVELKLPWQLLNFADPSRMTIHDDYYENYGVDYITIDTMYLGLTDGEDEGRSGPPRSRAGAIRSAITSGSSPRTTFCKSSGSKTHKKGESAGAC